MIFGMTTATYTFIHVVTAIKFRGEAVRPA